jgi:hypothetical protein
VRSGNALDRDTGAGLLNEMKSKPKEEIVTKISTPTWKQQLHKGCGGMLLVIAKPGKIGIICHKCNMLWQVEVPLLGPNIPSTIPDDWESYEPKPKEENE